MTLAPGIDYFCNTEGCIYQNEQFWKSFREEVNRPKPMEYPGVAVGVIVGAPLIDDCCSIRECLGVILGKRKGPLGTGMYSLPGGKVDFGESPVQAAIREVKEETGLDITDVRFTGKVSNDYFPDKGKHYINLFYTAVAKDIGQLHVPESEKEKFEEWVICDPRNLPEDTWVPTGQVINAYFSHTLVDLNLPDIDGKS